MSTHQPTLLRWAEEAEAEQVSAIAMVEHEPQEATCPVARAGRSVSGHLGQFPGWRLLSRLLGKGVQISRDGGR